jgi:plastocyanin
MTATMMSRVALCLCLSSLLVGAAFCQGEEEMMMATTMPADETASMPAPEQEEMMMMAAIMPAVEEEETMSMPERPTAGDMSDTSGGVDLAPLEDLESAPEATMDEHVVEVGSSPPGQMIYNPESITIKSGDTVTWVNVDGIPHDVIFNEVPEGASNEDLSHPDLWSTIGQNVSSTFTVPGTYEYYCTPHRALGMLGSVVVEAA